MLIVKSYEYIKQYNTRGSSVELIIVRVWRIDPNIDVIDANVGIGSILV